MRTLFRSVAVRSAWLPWAWILGLVGLAIRAKAMLGYWPSPSHPDPKLLPFELHHMALWVGFLAVFILLPIWIVTYAISWNIFKRKLNVRPLGVFLSGASIIGALIFLPHFSFNWVAWFLD